MENQEFQELLTENLFVRIYDFTLLNDFSSIDWADLFSHQFVAQLLYDFFYCTNVTRNILYTCKNPIRIEL